MNGPIAQIAALTCHGNAFLSGYETGAFFPTNSTCTFCDRVHFIAVEKNLLGKITEKAIAKTPDEWFSFLKLSGARGLRLSRTPENDPRAPDRMLSAFVGGGGTWAMEVLLPHSRSEYYIARWSVRDENEDRWIWRVAYGCVSSGTTLQMTPPDLANIAGRLTDSVLDAHAFSEKHKFGNFALVFADALDTLKSNGKNLHGEHKDLSPVGFLSTEASAILDACQSAWVFGGMGSWNDSLFEGDDEKEYDAVSEQLFQSINEAIAAAVNSTSLDEG